MICFVDMEHPETASQGAPCAQGRAGTLSAHGAYCRDVQRRLETASGRRCLIRRLDEVNQDWLQSSGVGALVLSGNVADWELYEEPDLVPLMDVVRRAKLPILGLCGGLQFIAIAHGAEVGPMRRLRTGEQDVDDGYGPGFLKEWGYQPVRIVARDPLFDGLEAPVFLQAHYWEVKDIPAGFKLLASTEMCRIQVLGQVDAPVYGTQFHPEAYIVERSDQRNCLIERIYPTGYRRRQPDGHRLLSNFFRTAGLLEP